MDKLKYDSLQSYHDYSSTINDYWRNAYEYINQIHDSTLRADLNRSFDTLNSKYRQSKIKYDLAEKNLYNKEYEMKDCEILLKLYITKPMMENYQRNEMPNINQINAVAKKYDTIINATKKYTK